MLVDTPVCDFGWDAPRFTLNDPNGTAHSLADYLGEAPVLIAFLCNHCPYVKRIADRFADDTAELASHGIATLAIMSNDYRDYPADAPDMMLAFAETSGWAFPYLVDEDQSVGRAYDAKCTPDFFGLNKDGQLQYRGRLDNLAASTGADRDKELVKAMLQIQATGHGPAEQIASMGCSIKWTG